MPVPEPSLNATSHMFLAARCLWWQPGMQNPIIPNRFILVFLHWSTQKIDPGILYGLNHFTTITRCGLQLIKIISTDLQVLYRKILCKDPRPFFCKSTYLSKGFSTLCVSSLILSLPPFHLPSYPSKSKVLDTTSISSFIVAAVLRWHGQEMGSKCRQ